MLHKNPLRPILEQFPNGKSRKLWPDEVHVSKNKFFITQIPTQTVNINNILLRNTIVSFHYGGA